MKYINPKSDSGFVNKFADFIVAKLGDDKSIIKVTKFEPFYVIEGKTTSKKILNIDEISTEFSKIFASNNSNNLLKINTIDLIKYDVEVSQQTVLEFEYYNSDRPMFHESVLVSEFKEQALYETLDYKSKLYQVILDKNIWRYSLDNINFTSHNGCVSSEFPHGYSLLVNRNILYYLEYISFNVQPSFKSTYMNFKMVEVDPNKFEIIFESDSPYPYQKLHSIILDVFDFNFEKFQIDFLSGYDLSSEVDNQLSTKPWLVRNKINEVFVI